jgi:hypothetical protein
MLAFLCNFMPRSVNAEKKEAYYAGLVSAFRNYHAQATISNETLYGFVYYFHKVKTPLDADNLSKPIWDALIGSAFTDDSQIRFRSSGLFDLSTEEIDELDLTAMPDYVFNDFLEMIDGNDRHILYVEFGKFDYGLIQFGFSK